MVLAPITVKSIKLERQRSFGIDIRNSPKVDHSENNSIYYFFCEPDLFDANDSSLDGKCQVYPFKIHPRAIIEIVEVFYP